MDTVYKMISADDLLNGSLLGDGSLSIIGKFGRANSIFSETHCIKQLDYLLWKSKILEEYNPKIHITNTKGRVRVGNKISYDDNKTYDSCYLRTRCDVRLTEYEKIWYLRYNDEYILSNNKRIKAVPKNLSLNKDSLMVWLCDDGSNNIKNRQYYINTHAFTYSEVDFLIHELIKVSGLTGFSICKNRDKPVIGIKPKMYLDWMNFIITMCPVNSLRHKFSLHGYRHPYPIGTNQYTKNQEYGTHTEGIKT